MQRTVGLNSILAAFLGICAGGVFLIVSGYPLFTSFGWLFSAGFGCREAQSCALLTTLQFATPLILAGLSAAVAFRSGFFNLGQAGQMALGAGAAAWIGGSEAVWALHPLAAVAGAALAGASWILVPGLLKLKLGVNEIVTTIVLNGMTGFALGFIPMQRGLVLETARLAPLAAGTKLNQGLFLALAALAGFAVILWGTGQGYAVRMVGQAPRFARYGGMRPERLALQGILLSGMLAGMAGAVEVLGVHYRFITGFSADATFDGVMVALLGQSQPLGVMLAAFFVGGIRLGSLNGLLMLGGIPRELGNAILASMMIFMTIDLIRPLHRIDAARRRLLRRGLQTRRPTDDG